MIRPPQGPCFSSRRRLGMLEVIGGVCKRKKDDQVISYASFLKSENLAGILRQKGH